jgi:hypothetical protein
MGVRVSYANLRLLPFVARRKQSREEAMFVSRRAAPLAYLFDDTENLCECRAALVRSGTSQLVHSSAPLRSGKGNDFAHGEIHG